METIALVASTLLLITMLFQLALAAGAPWGSAAWGGRKPGVLTPGLRSASAFAGLVVYPWITLLVMDAGRLVDLNLVDRSAGAVILWVLTGLFGLGALANAASPSKVEKFWAPVAGGIALCCGILAAGI